MNARRFIISISLACLLVVVPFGAHAATQTVRGFVFVPATENCAYEWAILQTSVRAGKVITYSFPVNPAVWGGSYLLTPDRSLARLSIWFLAGGRLVGGFGGMSSGSVPVGATEAQVCLLTGPPTGFTYTARR